MTHRTYILFSKSINKYYTGYTSLSIRDRLAYHLNHHKGFTAKTNDWIVVFEKEFETKSETMALEKQIKKRGAKRFLDDLNQ